MRTHQISCRACGAPATAFMSFGAMPISNHFIAREEVSADAYRFELATAVCGACGMFQLVEQPAPEQMFHGEYAFFSRTSRRMEAHFETFANTVHATWLKDRNDPFVVELGSNDGIMLRHFARRGLRHLGIEPSANVATAARADGVETLCAFFDEKLAAGIVTSHGHADAILAANVMCHIGDISSVVRGFAALLKPDGIIAFEDPYLADVIEKGSYDQIYDEHVFLFSVQSVRALFAPVGLSVIDVEPQDVHGGSMRYVLGRTAYHGVSPAVARQEEREQRLGLREAATYEEFRRRCERSRTALVGLLRDLKAQGKRIVGYGATSKSATVLGYCGIGAELIEFITDTTPTKQGKLTPASHIPVMPHEAFTRDYPDYALLFAWNHQQEIVAKEADFLRAGGKFIVYFPDVRIIG